MFTDRNSKFKFLALLSLQCWLVTAEVSLSDDPSLWPGHLEPLAAKSKKTSLESIDNFPSPEVFFRDYSSKLRPVLIRGGAKQSKAFDLWTDEYFKGLPEAAEIEVLAEGGKKENRTKPAKNLSFKTFVENYKTEDVYMVNGVPNFLQKDVLLPPPLLCEDVVEDMLVDTVMWFSSGGTKSVVHNDDVDNINCLFSGTKELLFMDYKKYKGKVKIDHPEGGYSGVDVDRVDFTKYPGLREVEFYNVTMQPGDCLFIPYKWFHQVRSFDRNIAVNVWFQHKADFVPKKCNMEPGQTLDKFKFSSLEENGDPEGPGNLFEYYLSFVTTSGGKLSPEQFVTKMKEDKVMMGYGKYQWNQGFTEVAQTIFKALDADGDQTLSKQDFDALAKSEEITEILEREAAKIEDLLEDQQHPGLKPTENEIPNTADERDEL